MIGVGKDEYARIREKVVRVVGDAARDAGVSFAWEERYPEDDDPLPKVLGLAFLVAVEFIMKERDVDVSGNLGSLVASVVRHAVSFR